MNLIILPILLPLALAAVVPLGRRNIKTLAVLPLVGGVFGLAASLLARGTPIAEYHQAWVAPFTLDFSLDAWKLLLLGFVVLFEVMTGIFALTAVVRAARPGLLVASLLLAFASAAGVVLTDNVLVLLVFWETFLLALYGAIASGGKGAERVAQKALVIGGASDFLMILGLMAYLALGGSPTLVSPLNVASCPTALVAFVLIFLGAGAKAGMFPFHTWIPEAAEVMPAAGFAALPASLEKILGISFLFTLTSRMFVLDDTARGVMLVFAVATAFVVIVPALVEKNLKKVLALTAISPVGFMIAGMATSQAAGMIGALLYMLTHATYKSGMFFAAGAFEDRAGTPSLDKLHGIGRLMPACGWGFVLAFAAAISLPPTGGFMAKELIFEGLIERGFIPVLALLFVAAVINIAVFCKLLAVVMGRPATGQTEAGALDHIPAFLLGVVAILTGVVFTFSEVTFSLLAGEHQHFDLRAVWHLGPLTMVSLAIYLLGFMLYSAARSRVETAASTFDGLRSSPVLGPGLAMAEAKKLDAYEIGLKVVGWLTRIVFRIERLIDQVADGIIQGGREFSRHFLSSVHSGVYSNYLGWALAGLIVVLGMVFLR